jgi:hypothetical protein
VGRIQNVPNSRKRKYKGGRVNKEAKAAVLVRDKNTGTVMHFFGNVTRIGKR